ncbi:MAG: cell division protein FtsQ/DivIB [Pseudomonadota bacterium]
MTEKQRKGRRTASFTAYSGAGEIPEDFALQNPVRRHPDVGKEGRKPRRGRLFLLLAVLGLSVSLAWQQHGSRASALVAEHVSLPSVDWPERLLPEGPLLDRSIRSVQIDTPLSRLKEEEIRDMLASHLGEGFFSLDVEQLRDELQRHPWVSQAAVRRVWPDGLTVSVEEHRPIARWGRDALINLQGELFGEGDMRDAVSLPRLDGPSDSPAEVMRQYQQFSRMLQSTGLRIQELRKGDRGSWRLVLDSGVRVDVGREDLMERMQRFVRLYRDRWQPEGRQLASVDLRYANGLAVRFGGMDGEDAAAGTGRVNNSE